MKIFISLSLCLCLSPSYLPVSLSSLHLTPVPPSSLYFTSSLPPHLTLFHFSSLSPCSLSVLIFHTVSPRTLLPSCCLSVCLSIVSWHSLEDPTNSTPLTLNLLAVPLHNGPGSSLFTLAFLLSSHHHRPSRKSHIHLVNTSCQHTCDCSSLIFS